MYHLEVAVPAPLPQTYTYTSDREVPAGTRVVVPFGRRRMVGVALGPAKPVGEGISLKPIDSVVDQAPVYSPVTLELARWIASYYMHPLGEVLRTMLPAGTSKVVKESFTLSERAKDLMHLEPGDPRAQLLAHLFAVKGKRSREAGTRRETLMRRLGKWNDVDAAADRQPDVKLLIDEGWITQVRSTSVQARAVIGGKKSGRASSDGDHAHADDHADGADLASALWAEASASDSQRAEPGASKIPELTSKQQVVVDAIMQTGLAAPQSQVFLLRGVTGSGKTEVYLRLIAEVLREGAGQALVLVPEISLTPQMTRVFEQRFPGIVAVVHSAMSDSDRWAQLDRVRCAEARILIGPRSAVFGPFAQLRLLIVDEEHDSSYKQTTGLTYNGRDLAVLRGKLEKATVVLGSATPSMESLHNAVTGRYRLLEMPERVSGRPLPEVEVIAMQREKRRGSLVASPRGVDPDEADSIPIDERVIRELEENRAAGRQAIVLVNRRGYAYYLFSLEEKKAVQCPQCSISFTLHARSSILRCHYCDNATTVDKILKERPDETFIAVGYGSQKAEDFLIQKLPQARIVRLDSDTVVKKDYLPETLAKFRKGEIDILVGTQILAKGHDFPNVTLIVILEVDQLLGLPDFRAGERTFQLIVQAAGRAGRAELPGRVLIQAMRASHPVVATAVTQDFKAFAERELMFRQMQAYPPFARMIAFEFNSPDKRRLVDLSRRIEAWVEQMAQLKPELVQKVRVLGPAVPPIETIRGRHRRHVILSSDAVEPLRKFAGHFAQVFAKPSGDVRMKVDVDPQSLI